MKITNDGNIEQYKKNNNKICISIIHVNKKTIYNIVKLT